MKEVFGELQECSGQLSIKTTIEYCLVQTVAPVPALANFPKGTNFRGISHVDVRRVEKLLNSHPRACLGFRTPDEVFFEKTPPAVCD